MSDTIDSRILTFADDTKIVSPIQTVHDTINLQANLDKIIKWSDTNNMKLNDKKFELICNKLSPDNCHLKLFKELPFHDKFCCYKASNDIAILPSAHVRDLGVLVDTQLSWNTHITHIAVKARQITGWILNVFHSRDKLPMLTLFNSLVRSKLEYCSVIWNPYLTKDINSIENIQRSFTSRIKGMQLFNYWERLVKLNIMSLQRRREKHLIIHLWKIKNNIYPNSIDITFKLNNRSQAIKAVIKPLPKIKGKILTIYDESFAVKSAKLWNILPSRLTHIDNIKTFTAALNIFLSTIPDKPPIPGYPYTCNNSLTEISQLL